MVETSSSHAGSSLPSIQNLAAVIESTDPPPPSSDRSKPATCCGSRLGMAGSAVPALVDVIIHVAKASQVSEFCQLVILSPPQPFRRSALASQATQLPPLTGFVASARSAANGLHLWFLNGRGQPGADSIPLCRHRCRSCPPSFCRLTART